MEGLQEAACSAGTGRRRATKRKCKTLKLRRHRRSPGSLFPLALAALNNPEHPSSAPLVIACLNEFLHLLFPKSLDSLSALPDDHLLTSLLALLPLLLKSRCTEIVSTSLKILGAASLITYEVNEKIALEEGVSLRILLPKVLCQEEKVAMAACNALLDVSSTSLGRQRLVDLCALNYLLLGFLQFMKSSTSLAFFCISEKEGVSCLGVQDKEDELPMLLLTAAVSLINFCSVEQLERIPRKLMGMSIACLKNLWAQLREQILCGNIRKTYHGRDHYVGNLTTDNLAETIFRISLNASLSPSGITFNAGVRHIVGADKFSFQNFILNIWESSPFLTQRAHVYLHESHDIFNPFAEFLNAEGTFPLFISSMLKGMVSCYPLALDEMDILRFLKDVKALACPIVYQRDIRVVRTEPCSKCEEHFFADKLPKAFTMDDILRCEAAYREGYTIALRGMEFRLKNIAAVANKVASLFGQPSVGANLYLTPPGSQGLACHYDDHCVFVYQLWGTKLWTIFPEPVVQLPRLYDRLEQTPDSIEGSKQILLGEGDVLYIPRGFPHKACTFAATNEDNAVSSSSLHLTLAIEIEPPFEWEGFMHVALLQWNHSTKSSRNPHSCSSENSDAFSIILLHVAIRLVSNCESAFRKACMVAAVSFPSDNMDWLDQNQRAIFNQLVDKIYELCSFLDAFEYMQTSIQSNEDPFHWMRWLHVLDDEEMVRCGFNLPLEDIEKFITSIFQHKEDVETKFLHAKARFCREITFDDVKEKFKMIHAMFKKVRTQYMKGMLSLHY